MVRRRGLPPLRVPALTVPHAYRGHLHGVRRMILAAISGLPCDVARRHLASNIRGLAGIRRRCLDDGQEFALTMFLLTRDLAEQNKA